jgi:reticulon-4-interacting protein 1, mitochondrial
MEDYLNTPLYTNNTCTPLFHVFDRRYPKPDFLSFEQASSIYLSTLTAYQCLICEPRVRLIPGQSVFINGGSGGVGLYAVQIARNIVGETGKVVASCSSRNAELVKENGADQVIDYTAVDLPRYLSDTFKFARFDLILDCIGSDDLLTACPIFLKPKGSFVIVGMDVPHTWMGILNKFFKLATAMFLPTFLGGLPRHIALCIIGITNERIEDVGGFVKRKDIRPVLDSVWTFDDEGIKAAYQKIMSRRARGKVVIKIV